MLLLYRTSHSAMSSTTSVIQDNNADGQPWRESFKENACIRAAFDAVLDELEEIQEWNNSFADDYLQQEREEDE